MDSLRRLAALAKSSSGIEVTIPVLRISRCVPTAEWPSAPRPWWLRHKRNATASGASNDVSTTSPGRGLSTDFFLSKP